MAADYYQILGLTKTATDKEIKSAYRRLARKYHPDVNPGDKASEEQFKKVSEAYEVLKDSEKRAAYDRFGSQWEQAQRAGVNNADFGSAEGFNFDYGGASSPDFGNLFETFFGGGATTGGGPGRGGFGGFTPPQRDVEAEVDISLEEAYSGGERQLNMTNKKLSVKIPPGVTNGSRIRIAGKAGGRGAGGDVYLNVKVRPHPQFTRDADNLLVDVPISYIVAGLGGEVSVPTMTGRVTMKVPAGVQSGQTLRLSGKGMPHLKGGGHGDLLAKIMITIPKPLSPREQELFKEIASGQGIKAG